MQVAILTLLMALLCAVIILIGEVMGLRAQLRKRGAVSGGVATITVEADTTDVLAKIAKVKAELDGLRRSLNYGSRYA